MAQLQNLLAQNGGLKDDLMQAFVKTSIRDNSGTTGQDNTTTSTTSAEQVNMNYANTTQQTQAANNNYIQTLKSRNDYNANQDMLIKPETRQTTNSSTTTGELKWDTMQSSIRSASASNNDYNVDQILDHAKTPSEGRLELINHYTQSVIDSHLTTTINLYKIVNEANEVYERKKANDELPKVENLNLLKDKMWDQFKTNMAPEIEKVVKFCKKLPGFSEMDVEDQVILIKQGTFEVLLTRFCMLVDYENGEMFDPGMKLKVSKDVVRQMPLGAFLLEFFNVAETFNPHKLTDGEIGIFTALLIFSPDREGLKNASAVFKIRVLFEQILYQQLKSNHLDPDKLFRGLMASITMFRDVNARHSVVIANMKKQQQEKFEPLHEEIFDEKAA